MQLVYYSQFEQMDLRESQSNIFLLRIWLLKSLMLLLQRELNYWSCQMFTLSHSSLVGFPYSTCKQNYWRDEPTKEIETFFRICLFFSGVSGIEVSVCTPGRRLAWPQRNYSRVNRINRKSSNRNMQSSRKADNGWHVVRLSRSRDDGTTTARRQSVHWWAVTKSGQDSKELWRLLRWGISRREKRGSLTTTGKKGRARLKNELIISEIASANGRHVT